MDLREDMKGIFNQSDTLNLGLDFLLFVVAFSIPFSSAFNSIAIAVLFFYSFIFTYKKGNFFLQRNKHYIFLFLLFFSLQIISIFYSNNSYLAVRTVSKSLAFLFLPITFINLSNSIDNRRIRVVIYGLMSGVLFILFSAHLVILIKIINENLSIKTLFSQFIRERFIENAIVQIHSPYFGLLTIFTLISSYKLNYTSNTKINLFIKLTLIIYLTFSLYEISALMSQIILLIFVSYQVFHIVNKKKTKILILGVILASVILTIVFSLKSSTENNRGAETIFNRVETILNNGDTTRKENWKSVITVIKSNFVFGVGSDGGLDQVQKIRDKKSEAYINAHNAHNQYLEVFLRYGFIGFGVFILLIVMLVKQAFTTKNYFFNWFLVVFLASSLTESLLQRQIGIVFFVFFATLFAVYQDKS